jgi:hypothetical protein
LTARRQIPFHCSNQIARVATDTGVGAIYHTYSSLSLYIYKCEKPSQVSLEVGYAAFLFPLGARSAGASAFLI